MKKGDVCYGRGSWVSGQVSYLHSDLTFVCFVYCARAALETG